MVQMQDNAAERDVCYEKKRRHQYGGILGPVWQDVGEPEDFNESLPCIRQDQIYDSDDYLETFDSSFKMAYPITNLGHVLEQMGHKVSRERLQWPMQMRDQLGCMFQERASAKRGIYDPDDVGQYRSTAPSEQWESGSERAPFAVPRG